MSCCSVGLPKDTISITVWPFPVQPRSVRDWIPYATRKACGVKQVAVFCKSVGQESLIALRSVVAGSCTNGVFGVGVEVSCEVGATSRELQAASKQHISKKRKRCPESCFMYAELLFQGCNEVG